MKCKKCGSKNIHLIDQTVKKGQYVLASRYICKDCKTSWREKVRWEDATYLLTGTQLQKLCGHAVPTTFARKNQALCLKGVKPGMASPLCKLQCTTLLFVRDSEGKLTLLRR